MKINFLAKAVPCVLIAGALFVSSCKKDNADNDNSAKMYTVSGSGSGAQVVPVVSTGASSTLTGTYNSGTNQLQYNVSWTGLAATADSVRFYNAASGSNATGNASFTGVITTPGMSGSSSGTVTLTDAQETQLLAGNYYYTVSNSTYLAGEVRGQITTVAQ